MSGTTWAATMLHTCLVMCQHLVCRFSDMSYFSILGSYSHRLAKKALFLALVGSSALSRCPLCAQGSPLSTITHQT